MSDVFEERMKALKERFVVRAQDERAQLIAALAGMDRDEVRRLAHGLSGSGGVFGFPEISLDAQALEEAVDEQATDAEVRRLGSALISRLEAARPDC